MKAVFAICGLGLLVGCGAPKIDKAPITVTPIAGSQANFATLGQKIVPVRTKVSGDNNVTADVANIPCLLKSDRYEARFLSPANVIVPDLGRNSPVLFVHCEINGRIGTKTVQAFNKSLSQRNTASIGVGTRRGRIGLGTVLTIPLGAPPPDDFRYPDITVVLK